MAQKPLKTLENYLKITYNNTSMSIHTFWQKIKSFMGKEGVLLAAVIILVGCISFLLGRLSVLPVDREANYIKIVTPDEKLLYIKGE